MLTDKLAIKSKILITLFVVSWTVETYIPVPCPDSGEDNYGRISTVSCSVLHTRHLSTKKNMEFKAKKEAINFIESSNIPIGFSFSNSKLFNFSINEISE